MGGGGGTGGGGAAAAAADDVEGRSTKGDFKLTTRKPGTSSSGIASCGDRIPTDRSKDFLGEVGIRSALGPLSGALSTIFLVQLGGGIVVLDDGAVGLTTTMEVEDPVCNSNLLRVENFVGLTRRSMQRLCWEH